MATAPPYPFSNGQAPKEWFIKLLSGRYTDYVAQGEDAEWAQWLTPAMYDFHIRLIARAYRRTGRTLALSSGCSAYRPIGDQRRAKRLYGRGAAGIGQSSHGLWFEGRYTAAFDYGNWAWVYANHGGKGAWYADIRAEGGIAGYFDPSLRPGTPNEPWHVIILDPFRLVVGGSAAGGGSSTFDPNGENELDATQSLQLSRTHDALVNSRGQFYYKPDAIINILRGETQPRLDGIVARTDASNTTLAAVIEALKALDPNAETDIAAFESKLLESEARTIAAIKAEVQARSAEMRAELITALNGIDGIHEDSITAAVDEAFGKIYVPRVPAA